ncbi:hypothetical protein [Paenibacillus elgii]|uniref:hypothetical protein n=1 Tax=Paenibacillus elgii TaxID=189691 RepID=UPI000248D3A7|nr:hypothetical protein [Paenibacillus elgii]
MEDFDECPAVYDMKAWRIDNSNYVNMKMITDYDPLLGKVYFNDRHIPSADVARIHKNLVKENLIKNKRE